MPWRRDDLEAMSQEAGVTRADILKSRHARSPLILS